MPVTVSAPPSVVISPTGVQGPRGNATLNGTGAPAATVGVDGDYYIDKTNYPTSVVMYGPKAAGAWPGTGVTVGASSGSGSVTRSAEALIKVENIALANAAGWTVVTTSAATGSVPLRCQIRAAVGDRIRADPTFMRSGTGFFLDLALLDSTGAISIYAGSHTATPLPEGNPAYYPQTGSFPAATGVTQLTIQTGQVDANGLATVALVCRGSGAETIYASATYPWYLLLTNLGPEPA